MEADRDATHMHQTEVINNDTPFQIAEEINMITELTDQGQTAMQNGFYNVEQSS